MADQGVHNVEQEGGEEGEHNERHHKGQAPQQHRLLRRRVSTLEVKPLYSKLEMALSSFALLWFPVFALDEPSAVVNTKAVVVTLLSGVQLDNKGDW